MKTIDRNSLVIDGVDSRDYPDFVDAYVSEGYYLNGDKISDEDLDKFNSDHSEIAQSMAFETLLN